MKLNTNNNLKSLKTIAIAWELGGGLGHLVPLLSLVRLLKQAGYRPILIIRDVSQFHTIFEDEKVEFIQAPIWLPRLSKKLPEINFTETLFHLGYLKPEGLSALTQSWFHLFTLIQPDLLLVDHSPTALIASRAFKIPKVHYGNSFSLPPQQSPLPAYCFWEENSSHITRMVQSEDAIVNNINYALKNIGGDKITHLADLYQVDYAFITSSALLDVYGERSYHNIEYIGSKAVMHHGVNVSQWPQNNIHTIKVFIYLKASYPHLTTLLQLCRAFTGAQFLVYIAGLSHSLKQEYRADNIIFSGTPYQMQSVITSCDKAILHGGGLSEKFIEVGKTVLLLPTQMEQTMTAYRIQKQQVAAMFLSKGSPEEMESTFNEWINNTAYNDNAKKLAKTLSVPSKKQQDTITINKINELLN